MCVCVCACSTDMVLQDTAHPVTLSSLRTRWLLSTMMLTMPKIPKAPTTGATGYCSVNIVFYRVFCLDKLRKFIQSP